MFNILFWNINGNHIENLISNCIAENDVDIAIFTEYGGTDFSKIENDLGKKYTYEKSYIPKTKIAMMRKNTVTVGVHQQQRRYSLYSAETALEKYFIIGIHLEDPFYGYDSTRENTIRNIVADVEKTEKNFEYEKTIIIGDFNVNPYDKEIIDFYCFNAVLFKRLIEENEYTHPRSDKKKRFYNPILSYISEENEMYGSFYYDSSPTTTYWHCLDQIIVRKSLVDNIENIKYLKKIDGKELLSGKKPDSCISDHLPLLVNFREV